jgi:GH15 family glucan-1,4-alpha-glucosidase
MWPRDGALVADAFASAGFLSVSRSFFQFCLKVITEEGYLLHKYNADGTVGSSWHPWLRQGVPTLPIQEDETALVLWALWRHFNAFRDVEAVRPLYRRLISNAADFLVSFRDEETGLPLPSYDLWEERFGIHLFTVAAVIGGLEAAARFATAFGEDEQAERYTLCAEETRQAMIKHMWSPPHQRFARMATRTKSGYTLDVTIDAANYGVFAFGALPADDPKVVATMSAIEERLSIKTQVGGVARYENDYYQQVSQDIENVAGNPWFICTLWVAQHKIAVAKSPDDLTRAREILEWVVGHALPSGVLAEQVHPYTGEPLSVSPLTWSHATFVTCVLEYVQARERLSGKHPTKQSPASVSIGVPNNA